MDERRRGSRTCRERLSEVIEARLDGGSDQGGVAVTGGGTSGVVDEQTLVTDGGEPASESLSADDGARDGETAPANGFDFREIVEGIDDPVFLKDREGRYRYVNERAAAVFDAEAEEVVGETAADLYDEATAAEVRAIDREVMESGESRTVETTREYAGTVRAFRTRKYPYAPDGEVEGVVGVARDVTAERDAEADLARNEQALRDLQRLAADRDLSLAEKFDRALEVGRNRLDLPYGFLTQIEDGTQTVLVSQADHERIESGTTAPLSETYCRKAVETEGLLAVEHASADGWAGDPAYEQFGLECYLGGKLQVDGELYGTLCFGAPDRRERSFSAAERTFIEVLIEWVSYEIERRERERNLKRHETILRSVEDGVYELDAEGTFTYVNPALAAMTGYEEAELVGEHVSTLRDDDDAASEALAALLSGEATERTVEVSLRPQRGPPIPCEDSMTALVEDGEVRGAVGVVRDVSEQVAQREMLSALVTSSRSFIGARDREEVAGLVARAVETVLGFELTIVRLFDGDREVLVPAGATDAVYRRLGDPETRGIDDSGAGRAFVDGEVLVSEPDEQIGSALHLPMGVHGTISIGADDPDAFSDVDRRAAELLATTAAAAANRAKREREVREARERVDTLVDRINGLIENTVEVLVAAGTREELEGGVVEQLAATEPYAFAWIARPDVGGDRVEAVASDGDVPALADAVEDYATDLEAAREAGDPVALALDEGAIRIVEDLSAVPDESVHASAREAGLGSLIAVPLTYRETRYGVLCVYAAESGAFADREQVVLAALGRAVANAVNAIESGRILSADRVIELEFTVQDESLLLGRISARTGATLELSGSVYESDGRVRLYVTATGADPADLEATLTSDDAVVEAGVVAAHESEVLLEVTVTDSLVELLADHGAVTRSATAEEGVVRYAIELPYEAEAREVFDLVADRYARTDLVGYHEHERPVRTRQEFREAVRDRFTDRQETAIRTAHLGGFFEWPREVDGDDLAESMDISRPTYHQHLRAAQRKVFEELFDPYADHDG